MLARFLSDLAEVRNQAHQVDERKSERATTNKYRSPKEKRSVPSKKAVWDDGAGEAGLLLLHCDRRQKILSRVVGEKDK